MKVAVVRLVYNYLFFFRSFCCAFCRYHALACVLTRTAAHTVASASSSAAAVQVAAAGTPRAQAQFTCEMLVRLGVLLPNHAEQENDAGAAGCGCGGGAASGGGGDSGGGSKQDGNGPVLWAVGKTKVLLQATQVRLCDALTVALSYYCFFFFCALFPLSSLLGERS